jgi:hypothetical protein
MEELANLADFKFSSKEVRQKGEKQDDFKSKLSRAIELMRVLTAHYSDWRAAFAAFQSRIFNVRGNTSLRSATGEDAWESRRFAA